jgi:exopolysaccharide biosynthesis polyprenyl glycosylphosphotransferase
MKTFWRSSFLTLVLIALDAVALSRMWLGAYFLRRLFDGTPLFPKYMNPIANYSEALPFLMPIWLAVLAYFKFYSHHDRIASLNRLGPIAEALVSMVVVCLIYNWALKPDFGRAFVPAFAVGAGLYLYVSRTAFRVIKRAAIRRGHGRVRALVVGAGELGRETMARVTEHPDIGFEIVGFVSASQSDRKREIEGHRVIGEVKDLLRIIHRHRVEEVFFAAEGMKGDQIFDLVFEVQREAAVVCKVVANMLYVIVNRAKVDEIIDLPVIAFRAEAFYPVELAMKRAMDLVGGSLVAILLAPLALVFALLIRLDSRGPVLFAHERVGKGGERFLMLKFRTMAPDCDPYAEAPVDQDDARITRFGRFLRRTSLDEIPQLINVLKGEMSLVGPRPEMPFIAEKYAKWQAARLEVKPGLTGLWQVAGRKNLPLHENLEYDFYYVKNQSLALDLEILLRTIPAVLLGKGAY